MEMTTSTRAVGPTRGKPRQRRFSSKCRRAAAEGQPRQGRRADRILEDGRHCSDGCREHAGLVRRRQTRPGRAAKVAMRGSRRRLVAARQVCGRSGRCAGGHGAQTAQLAGTHFLGQHGHGRQQRREDGQKPQPRGKAGPQRATERGAGHSRIIRTAAGGVSPAGLDDGAVPRLYCYKINS